MKLTAAQYWKLSSLQKDVEIRDLSIAANEGDMTSSRLRRRIHELEHALLTDKHNILKIKKQNTEKLLMTYRAEIAKELGVDSLDSYIVDTETLELIDEKEI